MVTKVLPRFKGTQCTLLWTVVTILVQCYVCFLCSNNASSEGLSLDDIDGMLKGLSAELEQMLRKHSSS